MDSRTKLGTFEYSGVTFVYDGHKVNGKNAPLVICPVCKKKRRVSRSTEASVKSGKTTGMCHSCSGKQDRSKLEKRNTGISIFPSGSIVYWDKRDPENTNRSLVECGICHEKRYLLVSHHTLKHGTGHCKFCAAALNSKSGKDHPRWSGGSITDSDGYVLLNSCTLSNEDLSLARSMLNNAGYVREHRLVVARSIGRSLTGADVVHHANGVKDDNRLENLSLKNRSSHAISHCDTNAELSRLRAILDQHKIPF